MLTYNYIIGLIAIEGLIKSYVIPNAINKYKLDETGTFGVLILLLMGFTVLEYFVLSNCITSEKLNDIFKNSTLSSLFILIIIGFFVNYKWFIAIYNKFHFWSTIGILSIVGLVNEFNSVFIRILLQNITGTTCENNI